MTAHRSSQATRIARMSGFSGLGLSMSVSHAVTVDARWAGRASFATWYEYAYWASQTPRSKTVGDAWDSFAPRNAEDASRLRGGA